MISRKHIYFVITILIPVLTFILIEGALRLTDYGKRPSLFIPVQVDFANKKYLMVNPNVAERYFSKHGYVPPPPHEQFLRNKPGNGYRIIIMGGSTAAGWPHPENMIFSRILKQKLSDTFPEREIEVINTAIGAVNSYTLLDFIDEILEQQPDALLIYAGHNEFYGALGQASAISFGKTRWIVNFYLRLQKLRMFYLLRDLILNLRVWLSQNFGREGSDNNHKAFMNEVIGQKGIPLGSSTYKRGYLQFQGNLRDIMKKAKFAGVSVIISEVVSNIRDHNPFISEGFQNIPPADSVYREAKILEAENKMEDARKAYYRAKDLDAMRFRASEDFNQIIHEVAAEYGVPVVPMKHYFEIASPSHLIGNNLMLEHLHPNEKGHFIMSEAFFETMNSRGFIEKQWDKNKIMPDLYYRQNWGITELDRAFTKIRIIELTDHLPFKAESKSRGGAKNFVPESIQDALAMDVYFGQISLKDAHRALAERFIRQGQYELAVKEYKSIVIADPLDLKTYLEAASGLLAVGQTEIAKPFLLQLIKLGNSEYTSRWINQLFISQDRLHDAIPYLENAITYIPGDPQLLFNLCKSYILTQQTVKAKSQLAILTKTNPNFPNISDLKKQLGQ
jgi:tetratricopeptide (TPR) repeat protein